MRTIRPVMSPSEYVESLADALDADDFETAAARMTDDVVYTIGDREIEAGPGEILVVPAGVPHKFRSLGPEMLESIDIHASERFVTDWLE